MEPRRSEIILKQLKEKDQRPELLSDIPLKTVHRALLAWPLVWKAWHPEEIDYQDYHVRHGGIGITPDTVDALWLWETVQFDQEAALLHMGGSFANLITKLASAFAIYPDGTTAQGFLFLFRRHFGKEK